MKGQPASETSINELIYLTLGNIDLYSDNADRLISLKSAFEKILVKEISLNNDSEIYKLFRLIEYNILICLVSLDFSTMLKLFLRPQKKYDQIFACKQLYIIIIESFKKIYGFSKAIKDSFWVKDIAYLVNTYSPSSIVEYDSLTLEITKFCEDNFKDGKWKDNRDLSVHYDIQPSKVYHMVVNFSEDELLRKSSTFCFILNKTMPFSLQLLKYFNEYILQKLDKTFYDHLDIHNKWMEEYKYNNDLLEIITRGKENLLKLQSEYNTK